MFAEFLLLLLIFPYGTPVLGQRVGARQFYWWANAYSPVIDNGYPSCHTLVSGE